MEISEVVCPTCFEPFAVANPPYGEYPASVDYDCEICCRPMVIHFEDDPIDGVYAHAASLDDL